MDKHKTINIRFNEENYRFLENIARGMKADASETSISQVLNWIIEDYRGHIEKIKKDVNDFQISLIRALDSQR